MEIMVLDRLAGILADHNGAHPDRTYVTFVSNPDIYWLITEVERLRARLGAAQRLIEVVRAREIGTAGGVGAAFQAYDQAAAEWLDRDNGGLE